jgi:uncharacterized protein
MKEFVQYILERIVSKTENLKIEEEKDGNQINIRINVDPEEMGLVIGKNGRVIRGIRALVRAKAIKEGVRVNLELVDPMKVSRDA